MKLAHRQPPSEPQKLVVSFGRAFATVAGIAFTVLFGAFIAAPIFAQTNPMVDRLPAETWAYVSWGGTTSLQSVSSTNSVLRLWHDPAFLKFLQNSFGTVYHGSGPTERSGGLTPEQTTQLLSALENPGVIGFLNTPQDTVGTKHSPISFFLIYDSTGKQALVEHFLHERDANMVQPVQRSSLPVGNVTAEKIVTKDSVSYDVQAGNYFILTNSLQAMEKLVPRFTRSGVQALAFTQSADFPAECRELSQSATLNIAVLPSQFHMPANIGGNSGVNFQAFSNSLHLDRIRAGCASLRFERETTRMRGMVLGDMSQGSILNFMGNNRDAFATMSLASSNSAFQCSVIDFATIYNSVFTAASAAMPSDKAPMLAMGVAFLSSSWGMPPDQAFGLFTGEVATIHPDNAGDPTKSFYALAIQNPDKVLHILQHAIPGEHASTTQVGNVTYLTISTPMASRQNAATESKPPAFYLAVTPTMLLSAHEEGTLHEAVARLHSGTAAESSSLAADPDFRKARTSLPAKLDGMAYANYTHYNWQKLFADTEKNLNEQMQKAARASNKTPPPPIDLLGGTDLAALSHYLHFAISGSWKDSTGIYFDSYIQ